MTKTMNKRQGEKVGLNFASGVLGRVGCNLIEFVVCYVLFIVSTIIKLFQRRDMS